MDLKTIKDISDALGIRLDVALVVGLLAYGLYYFRRLIELLRAQMRAFWEFRDGVTELLAFLRHHHHALIALPGYAEALDRFQIRLDKVERILRGAEF